MSFGEALMKADISGLLLTNFLKLLVWGGFSLECTIDVTTLAGFPNLSLFIHSKMWPGAGEMVKYLPCKPEDVSLTQEPMWTAWHGVCLGRWRQADPRGSLVSQPHLKPQCLKRSKWLSSEAWYLRLASTSTRDTSPEWTICVGCGGKGLCLS